MTEQNTDSDLGLDGVPVAIGSGSRESLSAVPSTAAADGTRSVPRRVSRARAVVNLWGRGAIAVVKWSGGLWDLDNERAKVVVIGSATGVFISLLAAAVCALNGDPAAPYAAWVALGASVWMWPHAARGAIALVRAHSRAVDREVERLSKGGGA